MFFEIAQVAASAALVGLRCAAALSNGRTVALQPESEPGADERASKSEDPALATSEIDKTTGNYLDDVHAETEPSCRSPALVAAPTGVGTVQVVTPSSLPAAVQWLEDIGTHWRRTWHTNTRTPTLMLALTQTNVHAPPRI